MLILAQGAEGDVTDFKLCCELLDGRDGEQVEQARARWKKYKDEGHALTYWQQGEKSWEKKNST